MTLEEAQDLVERGYRVFITFRIRGIQPGRVSTRLIKEFNIVGQPVVVFKGFSHFVLRRREVISLKLGS